eukprot:g702.t1
MSLRRPPPPLPPGRARGPPPPLPRGATSRGAPATGDPLGSFPLSKKVVFDVETMWPDHGGGRKKLPDEEAFVAAFEEMDEFDCPASWRPVTRESFSTMGAWKQKKLVEALAKKKFHEYHFPHDDSELVGADLESVEWDDIVGIETSVEGLVGVLFVELPGKRAAVLKFPRNCCPEAFGNHVSLQCGIRAPQMKVVSRAGHLGLKILRGLIRYQIGFEGPVKWDESGVLLVQALKYDFFLLMEYVPGFALENHTLSSTANAPEWVMHFGDPAGAAISTIGSIIALDMLINNLDRIKTVRSLPASNPGNIYIERGGKDTVAIDSCAAWGSYDGLQGATESSFEDRIREIQQLTEQVYRDQSKVHPAFHHVRDFLRGGDGAKKEEEEDMIAGWPGLGLDIGTAGVLQIQRSYLQTVFLFLAMPHGTIKTIADALQHQVDTELIVDSVQWKDIVVGIYSDLDEGGQFASKITSAAGTGAEPLKILSMLPATAATASGCGACSPERCERVIDAWRSACGQHDHIHQ